MGTLKERLKKARKQCDLTQAELAKKSGLKQSDISKLERGEALSTTRIAELSAVLGVYPLWLATGKKAHSREEQSGAGHGGMQSIPINQQKIRSVYVVGWGTGGTMPERVWNDEDLPAGVTSEYSELANNDLHAFLVEVVGQSMVPRYNPGEFALIEPTV